MVQGIKLNVPWTFMQYEQTYQIYVDASKYGFGFAARELNNPQQVLRSTMIPTAWRISKKISETDLNIYPQYLLELKAIELALLAAPLA